MFATVCSACEGRGSHEYQQSHPFGDTYATEYLNEPCAVCDGNGYETTKHPVCLACGHRMAPDEPTLTAHGIVIHADCGLEELYATLPLLKEQS